MIDSKDILSAVMEDAELLAKLQEEGANLREVTMSEKWNFLHLGLLLPRGHPQIESIRVLLNAGVAVNAIDVYGNTPLYYAVRQKNQDAVRVLLKAGADVNGINGNGVTPLREALASAQVNLQVIKLLLTAGADPDHVLSSGRTILEVARNSFKGNDEVLSLFESRL